MASRQLWRRIKVAGRRVLSRGESAPRIARGVAAGFFAATMPVPGCHIPLSLLLAWLVRGSKLAALFPPFLWNPVTMLPMALLQFKIGVALWPAHAAAAGEAMSGIAILEKWEWSAPIASLSRVGLGVLGPLGLGVLITGLLAAAISYPMTVIAVWGWRARRRSARRMRDLKRQAPPPPLELPAGDGSALAPAKVVARYARALGQFRCAEGVKLLVDGGEAYGEMLAAVEGARFSVDLETYMIRADRIGARFQQALIRAARRGAQVRMLYDYIGSLGLPDRFVRPLLAAGVAVAVYHPLVLTRPSWALNRRDHRKNLVVDGRISFTGGLNIADEYASPADGGGGWRDTHLRLDGEGPAELVEELFEYGWDLAAPYGETGAAARQLASGMRRRLGRPVRFGVLRRESSVSAEVCGPGGVAVQVIGNREFHHRYDIRRAYMHAMKSARRYILIENAYFIPDRGIRRALAHAAARGVLVAVAIARNSDVTAAAYASRSLYSEILTSGVRLFEWPLGMLHAKTAVIDDAWAIVGSYNFDHRSLRHQLEAVAVVADAAFARRLRDQTLADLSRCREVTLAEHEARPWRSMLLESAAYLLRYWL